MLKTLEGIYERGIIKLNEDPQYGGPAKVLVVFLDEVPDEENREEMDCFIDRAKGILSGDGDYKKAKQEALDEKY